MADETQSAWRQWTDHPCWQDLRIMVEDIIAESIADEDRIPTSELTVAQIGEGRGKRKGLAELLRRIQEKIG